MPARPDDRTRTLITPGDDVHTGRMPSATAPAVAPPRWPGRKTAVAAALAVRGGRPGS